MSRVLFGFVLLSAAMMVVCLVTWARSSNKTSETRVEFPGADLAIGYDSGDFRMGAISTDAPVRWRWWSRQRTMDLSDVGPGADFNMDAGAWAISIPFVALVIAFAIPPAWWYLVFRDRREQEERVRLGLCLNCGYDPRGTPAGRPCPECGAPPRTGLPAAVGLPQHQPGGPLQNSLNPSSYPS